MTNIQFISKSVATAAINIQKTVALLQEDCTIPFISRYRKDTTGNLDEVQIENIAKLQKEYEVLVKRKEAILKSIIEQGAMNDDLFARINKSFDLQELEDFYLPYKRKKPKPMLLVKMDWNRWPRSSWRKIMTMLISFLHSI